MAASVVAAAAVLRHIVPPPLNSNWGVITPRQRTAQNLPMQWVVVLTCWEIREDMVSLPSLSSPELRQAPSPLLYNTSVMLALRGCSHACCLHLISSVLVLALFYPCLFSSLSFPFNSYFGSGSEWYSFHAMCGRTDFCPRSHHTTNNTFSITSILDT